MKRTELADACGIRKSNVTSLVDELLEKRFIRLENSDRPRSPLMMDENNWLIATLELDTDLITTGFVNLQGQITAINHFTSKEMNTKQGYLNAILKCAEDCIETYPDLLGLAISVPGIVNSAEGICISAINLPDFTNVKLLDFLSSKLTCPIVIENDVRSSLYASLYLDQRNGKLKSALYIDITSGVGSSLLVNSVPFSGGNGYAGEIGHIVAGNEGRICRCGQKDCLETYSSIPAICKAIYDNTGNKVKSSQEIVSMHLSDVNIKPILTKACQHISEPLTAMIALTDPEVVIFGNQPRSFYELILPTLKEILASKNNGPTIKNLRMEIAKEHSSMRGVAALLMEKIFRSP